MSTATANPASSTADSPASPDRERGDRLIGQHLEAARAALWRATFLGAVLRIVGILFAACLAFAVVDQWIWSFGTIGRAIWFLSVVAIGLWWIALRIVPLLRLRISPEYAAFSLEHDAPELRHALSSYVTLRPDRDAPGLRGIVVRSIGVRAARHLTSTGMAMPTEAGGTFKTAMTVIVIFAVLALYAAISPKNTLQSFGRLMLPFSQIDPPTRVAISEVDPGATETLFGRPLEITARINGLLGSDAPRIAVVGETPAEIALEPANGAERFSGQIPGSLINHSFRYSIIAGDASRGPFEVVVRNEPTVAVQTVDYAPHPYTKLPARTSSNGAIDGVEGTRVTVTATSNRPVTRGRIEFNPRTAAGRTSATAGFAPLDIADDGRTVSATWNLRTGLRSGGGAAIDSYRLRIWDDTDTPNPDPIEYPIRVQPDLAPELRIAVPAEWPKDVPLGAQQLIEVRALDPDFGLTGLRLQIRRGNRTIADPLLTESIEGLSGNQVALYRFRPDTLGLRAGDVVTVRAIATDNRTTVEGDRPDPNETASDPIELRIVAAPPRRQTMEDGDGLQPKDEQPAIDQPQTENPPTDPQTGEDQSGEGQSGESQSGEGQSGEGQSGDGQSGDGQSGEGQSGEGQSGESQSGEGQSGEGQSGEGQSGEGQSGEGQSGESQSGAGQSGEGQSGEGQSGEGQSGEGQSGEGQSGEGQSGEGQSGEDQSGEGQSGEGQSGEGQSGEGQSGESQSGAGQSGAGQSGAGQAGEGQSGEGQSGTGQDPSQTGGTSSTGPSPTGGTSSGEDRGGNERQRPASTDGEAFERIQNYLREQQASEQQSGESGGSEPETGRSPNEPGAEGTTEDETGKTQSGESGRNGSEPQSSPQSGDPQSGDPQSGDPQSGDPQSGDPQSGDPQSGDPQSGDPQSGDPQSGDPQSGDPQSGDPQFGDPQSGDPQFGDPQSGDPQSGDPQFGDPQSGDPQSGDPQSGDPQSGDPQSGEPRSGEPRSGEPQSGEPQSGEPQSGEPQSGEPQSGDPQAGDPQSGDPQSGEPQSGDPQSGDPQSGDPQSGESQPKGQREEDSESGSESEPKDSGDTGDQASPAGPGSPSGDPSGAMGGSSQPSSGTSTPGVAEPPPAPDPVNPEYARRATDLVLDALKNERDTPDPELLDELGWTPEQFRRFIDRWEEARRLATSGDQAAQEDFDEALRSLGIRPHQSNRTRSLDRRSDDLGTLRDSGSRVPPPPQFREAFEAFRRSVNQP